VYADNPGQLKWSGICVVALCVATGLPARAQQPEPITAPALHLTQPALQQYGPYNAHILAGGRGLTKSLPANDAMLRPQTPWTLSAWVEVASSSSSFVIAGVGDPKDNSVRLFALEAGAPVFKLGDAKSMRSTVPFNIKGWHFIAATSNGEEAHF